VTGGAGPVRRPPGRYCLLMTEQNVDPSGSTEQFKAFVQQTEAPSTRSFPVGVVVGIVAALVVVAVVVWLAVG
jgi:hypothetical protein